MGRLGGAIEEASQKGMGQTAAWMDLHNETEAKDGDIALGREITRTLTDPQTGFLSKNGRDAVSAYQDVNDQIESLYRQYRSGLSPRAAQMYDQVAVRRVQYAQEQAGNHARQQQKQWMADSSNARVLLAINDAGNVPNDDRAFGQKIGTIKGEVQDTGSLLGWSPETTKAHIEHYVSEAWVNRLRTIAEHDPAQARELYDANRSQIDGAHQPVVDQMIDAKQWAEDRREDREQAKADRLEAQNAAHMRVNLRSMYQNSAAMVENGIPATNFPSDKEIETAFPRDPDRADQFKEMVEDLRSVSSYLNVLPGATPEQVAKLRADIAPDPNQPSTFATHARLAKALDHALDIRAKAISADPAGYVVSTDKQLATEFQSAFQAATAQKGNADQFNTVYAPHVLALQETMGVPEGMRSVLPAPIAKSIAQSIADKPENAPKQLQQLQSTFGPVWQNVWRDIVTRGKLPAQFQAVGTLDNERDAALLARAITETQPNAKTGAAGKTWGDLIGSKPESDIKTAIRTDPSVRQLMLSLSRSGSSAAQIDSIVGSIDTLAFAKSFYDNDPKAAANAIESFTSKYQFMPDGGARVPAKSYGTVRQNADFTLSNLTADKIAVPSIFGSPGAPAVDEYLDSLKAAPNWITSPQADALWLTDPYGRLVRHKDGTPVDVPFSAQSPYPGGIETPPPAVQP